jgi:8-oxo-dGTP pyrophosphatase MutT (NUDIX family)
MSTGSNTGYGPHIARLRQDLREYRLRFPDERSTVERFEALVAEGARAYERARRIGHLTASAWVLDEAHCRVLLVHHKKLDKWLQPGGHADGETDLLAVARREVVEETAVSAEPLLGGDILDIDIHPIPPHGSDPAHEHFDVRFALVARGSQAPEGNEENHDARWVGLDELEELTTEASMLRMRDKARKLL